MSRVEHLKIKIASLAAESAIIRRAEGRLGKKRRKLADKGLAEAVQKLDWNRQSLHEHRKGRVAEASRNALLALAFFRHVPYAAVEPHTRKRVDMDDVEDLVCRFGLDPDHRFRAWHEEAWAYVEAVYQQPYLVMSKPAPLDGVPIPLQRKKLSLKEVDQLFEPR